MDLANPAYALDCATIDLFLSLVIVGAPSLDQGVEVKMPALLDLRGDIPRCIHISDGKLHDVNILDQLIAEAKAFYVMNRHYVDLARVNAAAP